MIPDLFSRRNASPCEKLVYDQVNDACRIQIVNIINDFFKLNGAEPFGDAHFWPIIHEFLKDEHGTESLYSEHWHDAFGGRTSPAFEVTEYIKRVKDLNYLWDAVEIVFRLLFSVQRDLIKAGYPIYYKADTAIEHLNKRLSQHCIGYKFETDRIIKIDSEMLYSNITKEVFALLVQASFKNINEEYLQAHGHFRSGNYKDSVVNCAKAFESTMKVICEQQEYTYDQGATATKLLDTLYKNHFLPSYLESGLSALRKVLENVSIVRNQTSAHGAGATEIVVDENLASFILNTTGSNIKFLLNLL